MISYLFTAAIISTFLIILLFYFSNKFEFISESPSSTVRKIHNKKMIKIGGLAIISYLVCIFPSSSYQILLLSLFSLFFLTIGLVADLNKDFGAKTRLIIFFGLISFYFIISGNYILHVDAEIINNFILFHPINVFFFSAFSLILLINGVNLIDGLHGFKLITMILIIIILIFHIPFYEKDLLRFLYCLLTSCIILFIANFFTARIKSGDAGSYFIAFIIGCTAIYVNNLKYMNSFYIATILSYPIIEVTYSYFRRIYNKSNPFKPDNLHLHSLLFQILRNKLLNISKDNQNRISTIILFLYQLFSQILIFIFAETSFHYIISLIILVFNYVLVRTLLISFINKTS